MGPVGMTAAAKSPGVGVASNPSVARASACIIRCCRNGGAFGRNYRMQQEVAVASAQEEVQYLIDARQCRQASWRK
jgi:hypothetical protein